MSNQISITGTGGADDEISQGTFIPFVRCTYQAAALIAVGVNLRKDPPYTFQETRRGDQIVVWNFQAKSDCGKYETMDLIKAWKHDVQWMVEHPTHPFTFAMLGVKSARMLTEVVVKMVTALIRAHPELKAEALRLMRDAAMSAPERDLARDKGDHNFARTFEASINCMQLVSHILGVTPFVQFRPAGSSATLSVLKGSAKHRDAIAAGLIQV